MVQFFERSIAIPIALDGQTPAVAFNNQIYVAGTYLPVWNDMIPSPNQAFHDLALEDRLAMPVFLMLRLQKEFGCLRMLDESPT